MYITLDEVEHMRRWGYGDFKLCNGWFIRAGNDRPMEHPMDVLYTKRGRDMLSDKFIKRVANGIIGMFLQTYQDGKLGNLYNPIWHAVVTSRVRLKGADFLNTYGATDSLIHFGTDGCLLDRPVASGGGSGGILDWNNGMGSWRFIGSEPTFVLSPGLLFAGSRHPKGINHDLLMSMVTEHPRKSSYQAKLPRRVTLAEAVAANDMSILGSTQDFYSTVDLHTLHLNQDRVFDGMPRTGQSLLNNKYRSEPVALG